jgi:hypothetical protein
MEGGALGENFCDLTRLIRSIQRLEGNPDCFGTVENSCERTGCAWREYCRTPLGPAGLPGETADETAHR